MTPTHIAVTKDNAQALVNYLQTKPYAEVHGLIDMIISCPGITIDQPKEAITPKEDK